MDHRMSRFIKGESRSQITLFPEAVDEYIEEDTGTRQYGDESACACLQYEASHQNSGGQAANRGNTGVSPYLLP